MRILYNLLFIIFGLFYLPYFIVTKRYKYGLANRFGVLSKRLKAVSSKGRVIWIHAVSLGEMKAASILAPLLRKAFPSHTLVFSSVTHTGNKVARTIATGEEAVFYLPFDISTVTDRVVNILRPELFLCLEAEIWPNLIGSLYKSGAKIVLVNGRISPRSYSGYKKIRPVISSMFNKFSLFLMQSEQDAVRILALGAPRQKVHAAGNLKFDLSLADSISKRQEIRERLNINDDGILFTAGSTNKGEEEQLIDCFSRLRKDYNNLRFLIAPRHIERAREIEQKLARRGLKSIKYSQIDMVGCESGVFLLDILGELKAIYSASDIVFVGGSLVKKRGGQNPIEPAGLSKPVIMGRYMANYQDVVNAFLENEAAIQVADGDELYSAIRMLIDDPGERKRLGANAKDTVDKNSGSSQRAIDLIRSIHPA
ncbi:MAG: 3-deoxy-D-manno-octulosonic acid transferase [Candidatus Omnitrophica bacterium]|nr:3-deoxy-D-manno-octulosonic acid transferase [Candidatus Omnitrophota bacterium]